LASSCGHFGTTRVQTTGAAVLHAFDRCRFRRWHPASIALFRETSKDSWQHCHKLACK